jgi:hypothetical protein
MYVNALLELLQEQLLETQQQLERMQLDRFSLLEIQAISLSQLVTPK